MTRFRDRRDAGRQLADLLGAYAHQPDAIVLGLPRGGIPVAIEVAHALALPCEVFVVRKLGLPWNEEVAFGAIATGGIRVLDEATVAASGMASEEVEQITAREQRELARREALYRPGAPPLALAGRTVILVDDGLATGASMTAAVAAVRAQSPRRVVIAVPVAASDSIGALRRHADDVVAFITPMAFGGVGSWYDDFHQVSDTEVADAMRRLHGQSHVAR